MVHEYVRVHVKFFRIVLDAIFVRNQGVIFQIVLGNLLMQLISHTYTPFTHMVFKFRFELSNPVSH